jgi:peptidyl-prolyl cis-trans isomerase C
MSNHTVRRAVRLPDSQIEQASGLPITLVRQAGQANSLSYIPAKLIWTAIFLLFLASCSRGGPAPEASVPAPPGEPSATAQLTATPAIPTATPEPLAARVNGEGITLAEYQAELSRYQAAVGRELTDEDRQRILNDLIDQTLLAQGAAEQGFVLDEAALESRLAQLTDQMGGSQALADWLAANNYDDQAFRRALQRATAAAWMRDEILKAMPATTEQVHARQILFDNPDEANQVIAQLDGGADFAKLAAQYDPATHGELGWFPRGYLLDPALEEAVFKLDAGQHTPVLQSAIGYHILQVVEKSAEQPLSPDALLVVQSQALQAWLKDRRTGSQIEIF